MAEQSVLSHDHSSVAHECNEDSNREIVDSVSDIDDNKFEFSAPKFKDFSSLKYQHKNKMIESIIAGEPVPEWIVRDLIDELSSDDESFDWFDYEHISHELEDYDANSYRSRTTSNNSLLYSNQVTPLRVSAKHSFTNSPKLRMPHRFSLMRKFGSPARQFSNFTVNDHSFTSSPRHYIVDCDERNHSNFNENCVNAEISEISKNYDGQSADETLCEDENSMDALQRLVEEHNRKLSLQNMLENDENIAKLLNKHNQMLGSVDSPPKDIIMKREMTTKRKVPELEEKKSKKRDMGTSMAINDRAKISTDSSRTNVGKQSTDSSIIEKISQRGRQNITTRKPILGSRAQRIEQADSFHVQADTSLINSNFHEPILQRARSNFHPAPAAPKKRPSPGFALSSSTIARTMPQAAIAPDLLKRKQTRQEKANLDDIKNLLAQHNLRLKSKKIQ